MLSKKYGFIFSLIVFLIFISSISYAGFSSTALSTSAGSSSNKINYSLLVDYFTLNNTILPLGGFMFILLILTLMFNILVSVLSKTNMFEKNTIFIISGILVFLTLPLKEFFSALNSIVLLIVTPETATFIYTILLITIFGFKLNIQKYFKSPKISPKPKPLKNTKKLTPKPKTKSKKKN